MMACIIMHNMVVEDEGRGVRNRNFDQMGDLAVPYTRSIERKKFVEAHHKLRKKTLHWQLQNDLIEHQWRLGSGQQLQNDDEDDDDE